MSDPFVVLNLGAAFGLFALGFFALASRESLFRVALGLEVVGKGVTLALLTAGYATGVIQEAQAVAATVIVIEVCVTALLLALMVRLHDRTGRTDTQAMRTLVG